MAPSTTAPNTMALSALDLFSVGIGPSSSHTVGPMRAARRFAAGLAAAELLPRTARVQAQLYGSLGATGHGHGSDRAVLLGLEGEDPETVDTAHAVARVEELRRQRSLAVHGTHRIAFDPDGDLIMHRRKALPAHPNGMTFEAFDADGVSLRHRTYYSVGGGFVVDDTAAGADRVVEDATALPHPFTTGAELLAACRESGRSIAGVMLANELCWRTESELRAALLHLWDVMQECVENGCTRTETVLPGGLKVRRRAPELRRRLRAQEAAGTAGDAPTPDPPMIDPLRAMEWVNLYALAVNEENASGGRIVTAPTNGAAGIIPAVLHYYTRFTCTGSGTDAADPVVEFLLTAAAIGILFKRGASISGAEVGCQGEVGSACSMAAGALCAVLGGTPEQVENAAEIGIEHNLGLTCDPVGGLVQIPCIERNAIASVKAINAARLARLGDGTHTVSLDQAIKTMRETGADMKIKYKETARGGLAVNVIEC
jgi:L-serine dehydratase